MPDVRPITTQQQLPRVEAPDEKHLSLSTGTETHAPYRLILTRTNPPITRNFNDNCVFEEISHSSSSFSQCQEILLSFTGKHDLGCSGN
jgi:hypothetical protein